MNRPTDRGAWAILLLSGASFAALFGEPVLLLFRDWWGDPEAGHGLLLAPAACWLAWRSRPRGAAARCGTRDRWLGALILLAAIGLRYLSGLAAELFTMRISVVLGLIGITTYYLGFRQVRVWGLPFALLGLAIPLPEVLRSTVTLPLQLKASRAGAALLEWRGIPVELSGNIITVPGRKLFVTEACSGLRSLTALLALSLLTGWMVLRSRFGRVSLVAGAIIIAMAVNAVRVFLTGFLVVFANPSLVEGFLHASEGWLLFLVSLAAVAGVALVLRRIEQALARSRWRGSPRPIEAVP